MAMFNSKTKLALTITSIVSLIYIIFSLALYRTAVIDSKNANLRIISRHSLINKLTGDDLDEFNDLQARIQRDILRRIVAFDLLAVLFTFYCSKIIAKNVIDPIEEAHHDQKNFTANFAHEIRTPLANIGAQLDYQLLIEKNKGTRKLLLSIKEEIADLTRLSEGLLLEDDFGRQDLRLEEISGRDFLGLVDKKLGNLANIKNINLKYDSMLKENMVIDIQKVLQVIVIIVDNAIKYSQSGQEVSLKIKYSANYYEFTVTDQGKGIPKAEQKNIFKRLYRVNDRSRTNSAETGFGLGLNIAEKIILGSLHGKILLSSKPNHGSVFVIKIPDKVHILKKLSATTRL